MKKITNIIISVIFKDKFFDIKSRADLFEYWVILLFYLFMPFSIIFLSISHSVDIIISYYFLFLAPWIISSAIVRRLHDLNLSGFWLFLILPIIPTLFIPGNKENNKYNIKKKIY